MNIYKTVFEGLLLWYACIQPASFDNETNLNDDELSQPKSLNKCNNVVTCSLLTPCLSRIRLLNTYNTLRSRIATGQFYGHPTVGNMLRVKWLMSVEAYTQGPVFHCISSAPPEFNVTIQGDPYDSNYTYTCDVIYISRLFEEWFIDEIIDYMIDGSFLFNYFNDFDENGRYQRISVEGFACTLNLNQIGLLTTEAFMGCGFCMAPPSMKPALNAKPCSQCDAAPADFEVIPSSCDYHFRSLCYARNSKIERSEIDTDYYLMNRETQCEAQFFLVAKKREKIPRIIDPSPVIFLKLTYIMPLLTIGLLVYYITAIKKQKIYQIVIPKQLTR